LVCLHDEPDALIANEVLMSEQEIHNLQYSQGLLHLLLLKPLLLLLLLDFGLLLLNFTIDLHHLAIVFFLDQVEGHFLLLG